MVSVPLAKIVANPFRDLTLFPLDEAQVEKLMRSMDRHGFFGGIRARQVDSLYQIGMGHHRVEAARRKKLGSIDIDIRDMSDADMIRLMTSENAIQAGSRAPAIMNEVSAAVGQLAMAVLSSEMLSQIRESIPEIAQCFQNQRALDAARGTLENGEGIGEPLIRSYLGGGDPDDCPRSKHQISDGLAALKSAGLYTKVISEVRDRIAAEAAEQERQAEQAEREAERAKSEAKSAAERRKAEAAADAAKKKKKSAGKASEARDRANRTSSSTKERQPQTYDPRCVNVFANAEQERAFREAVTVTAAARQFISVDHQLPLAKRMVKELRDREEYRGRLSATTISMFVSNVIQDAIRAQKQINEQERQALLHQQYQEMFLDRFKLVQWSLDGVNTNADKLLKFVTEHPEFAEHPKLGGLVPKIDAVIECLSGLKEQLHGKEVETTGKKGPRLIEVKRNVGN